MPKKSRLKRLGAWFGTTFSAVAALFYPPNIRNAFKQVTKNGREYICFYLATLLMGAGFWTVALCTESNLVEARARVEAAYDYHVEVTVPDNETYANLDNALTLAMDRDNKNLADFYWAYDEKPLPDGSYIARLTLHEVEEMDASLAEFKKDVLDDVPHGAIRLSPLYTFAEDFELPYNTQLWLSVGAWFLFAVFTLLVLFLIRLDHFRFVYGVYMTYGADFPKLMGAAGGELGTITALTAVPAAIIGVGIAAALYIPNGVGLHLTVRSVLLPVVGSLLAVFCAVWFPVRRMSGQPPIKHLAGEDNTALVSSPRRSFYIFGERFPGKYELYAFWRMRRYYLRLVLSAVLFAAVFVTGLYAAELVKTHNEAAPTEYLLTFEDLLAEPPSASEPETERVTEAETDEYGEVVTSGASEAETEASTPTEPGIDDEYAALLWGDLPLVIDDIDAIPGVSHVEWEASLSGGYTASHILMKPGQLYASGRYTVASDERASEGFRWAANNYAYTAIDEIWIDHRIKHGLCTFDGDPYAALTRDKHIIISEDVYNKKTYDFRPGDTIMVAVCEEVRFKDLVTDPKELLRGQIRDNQFRYETYTVAAVMRGMDSEDNITFGVPYGEYTLLTGTPPARGEIAVCMERGTDLDTVRAAEGELRRILFPLGGWKVTPTGNFFDAEVRALKNDRAVILTLAACLLLISPMVWYFSQILFYRKRRREFTVLRALGAPDGAFARIHRVAGGVLSGCAFLVTVLLSLLLNYGVYIVLNNLLPMMRLTDSIHYDFGLSLPALIACVAVSVLCGYLSCELPYRLYTRRDIAAGRLEL